METALESLKVIKTPVPEEEKAKLKTKAENINKLKEIERATNAKKITSRIFNVERNGLFLDL